jgi:hydrogenase-4 membrane subunit HyfE
VWDTLVSERTLQVILFLGVALLVAAAVSLVVWNWDAFPPLMQVGFLTLFTAIFYGLGWYVRVKLKLRGSGIALSAFASMLVPIEVYAIYLSGGFPRERWAEVWWGASLACLLAYFLTTYLIQAEFFGYLVGLAGGSLVCASLQLPGVGIPWWQVGLAVYVLLIGLAGELLFRRGHERWRIMASPFWLLALIAGAVILPWNLALGLTRWQTNLTFRLPLALTWWLGGLLFTFAAGRAHSRTFSLAAALTYPMAILISEAFIFPQAHLNWAWYAVGPALLALPYLDFGRPTSNEAERTISAEIAAATGRLLVIISAVWALFDVNAAALVHPILAVTVFLAARWWQKPRLIYVGCLFLLTGSAGFVAGRGLPWGQVVLAWALLAVGFVAAGVATGKRELFISGWWAALLSLLQPFTIFDRGLFVYTLGNWTALNGWLALLTHENRFWLGKGASTGPVSTGSTDGVSTGSTDARWSSLSRPQGMVATGPDSTSPVSTSSTDGVSTGSTGQLDSQEARFRQAQPTGLQLRTKFVAQPTIFQWITAASLPVWAWQAWLNGHPNWLPLPLVALLLAWGLLGWGVWLGRTQEAYRRPWHFVADVCAAFGVVWVLGQPQNWMAWLFLGLAAFYVAAAVLQAQKWLLWPASLLFPLGLALALDLADLRPEAQPVVLALVAMAYLLLGQALERWRGWQRAFLLPIYRVVYLLGLAGLLLSLFYLLRFALRYGQLLDAHLLWAAITALLLGIVFALRAWFQRNHFDGYLAAWLGAAACGLAASAYSHGTGRSAVLAALAAWGYLLLERGLTWLHKSVVSAGLVSTSSTGEVSTSSTDGGSTGSTGARGSSLSRPQGMVLTSSTGGVRRQLLGLFRWPLITTAWLIAAGTVVLVLIRNMVWLGGRTPITWGVVALWLIVGLFAASSRLYFGWRAAPRFLYVAGGLAFLPWSLMIWLFWPYYGIGEHAEGWAVLGTLEWLFGSQLIALAGWGQKKRLRKLADPLQILAQAILPSTLVFSLVGPVDSTAVTFGIGVVFYAACTWQDWRINRAAPSSTFLYPAVFLAPLWACLMLANVAPDATQSQYAALLLAFALPSLLIGRWLAHRQPAYRMPFYWLTYLILPPGTLLAADTTWGLVAALLLCSVVFIVSSWLFRRPLWLYPATVTLSLAWLIALDQWRVTLDRLGWGLLALAAAYLLIAWLLRRMADQPPAKPPLRAYATPLVVAALALSVLALPPSSFDPIGVWVGYGGAAAVCLFCAFWLRQPIFLTPAVLLSWVSHVGFIRLMDAGDFGLAFWPWIAALLAAAIWLDRSRGSGQPFTWAQPWRWPVLLVEYLLGWWAFPLFAGAFTMSALSGLLAGSRPMEMLNWLLAGIVYGMAIALFRRRFWLLACAGSLQLAVLAGILSRGGDGSLVDLALYFSPVIWITLLAGLWLEDTLKEGAPKGLKALNGWSRPLYLLVMTDIVLSQLAGMSDLQSGSAWVTLSHTLAAVLLAFWWGSQNLAFLALVGGVVASGQALLFGHAEALLWPWTYSLMAAAYGIGGYLLRWRDRAKSISPYLAQVWELPLCVVGWGLSLLSLLLAGMMSLNISSLMVRAILGMPLLDAETTRLVQMIVGVLAVQGIFYLTVALVERWRGLAYGAVALLLGAWSVEWLLIWGQREIQWYVLPTGVYLLVISFIEWNVGGAIGKAFARWLDRVALLLLLGSVFWQSLGDSGGWYALLMGVECLLIIWWGSARRLRRFLYIGVVGMMLDIFGQLIDPLLSANRWIVFGVGGAILVTLAILIERRLETVMKMSAEVRKRLEEWE